MNLIKNFPQIALVVVALSMGITSESLAQTKTEREEKIEGYKYEKRLVGPTHKKSSVLEIMVDKYNNYMVATFRAEKAAYTYLKIYRLYTWEEVLTLHMNDNRIELYNSTFDPDGQFFFANTDIYRNRFKKINLQTKEYEEVDCNVIPNGCQKIEPRQYTTEAYTENNHYYIYRPERFLNSILILKSRELIEAEKARTPNFLIDEEEEKKRLEGEVNMADPNQLPENPEEVKKIEQAIEKPKVVVPKDPINYVDLMLNKKTIDDLGRYKYVRYSEYEIIINNWLAATFEYERNKTKSITISEDEFKTLTTTGSVEKGELRLLIPANLIKN